MSDRIAEPLAIEYDGWDAIEHAVDAQKLGLSIQGIARLYRTTAHFYLTGLLPARLKTADVRVLAGPPRQGSLTYLIWVMMTHGRLAVYPQLLAEFADLCIPEFVKATLAKRGNQTKALEDAIGKIHDIAKENAALANRVVDFAEGVHKSDQIDKERLHGLIERLGCRPDSGGNLVMGSPAG